VRTAEVTIETEERIVLRSSDGRPAFLWCPRCRREVEMVTPEQAAQIAKVSTRTIYGWIESSTVHFVEDSRHTRVCMLALPTRRPTRGG
jgi:hypothetical protein